MTERLAHLRDFMRERALEALLISSPANRRYLSGFSGSAGSLLVTAEAALIFTDFRYRAQVARECPAFELRLTDTITPLAKRLAEAAVELGLHRIAFEAAHLSVAEHRQLTTALAEQNTNPPAFEPVEDLVEPLRERKDTDELTLLRRAIAITDAALAGVRPLLRPEHNELEAAWMLERAMREQGAEAVAFPIIVAAGPNGALPHARPGDTPLGEGRPIVIDMGARVAGYHADLTRTIVLGTPDAHFQNIYTIVAEAQRRAIAGARAGVAPSFVDALARDYITGQGYGEQFGHSTGHGVGLMIHEGPWLRRAVPDRPDQARLPAGAVTSIEPGIYIEEWGGVRIEDLVLITEQGCEVLSQSPR